MNAGAHFTGDEQLPPYIRNMFGKEWELISIHTTGTQAIDLFKRLAGVICVKICPQKIEKRFMTPGIIRFHGNYNPSDEIALLCDQPEFRSTCLTGNFRDSNLDPNLIRFEGHYITTDFENAWSSLHLRVDLTQLMSFSLQERISIVNEALLPGEKHCLRLIENIIELSTSESSPVCGILYCNREG